MNLIPSRPWQHSLWRLSAVLGSSSLIGAVLGRPLAGLAVGLVLALCWHYWQLQHLLQLLSSRATVPAAEGWGVFSEIQHRLFLRQREARQRKRRLQSLLHAFREAAAALPDGVIVLGRSDHKIAWFNEAAMRLLGLRHPGDVGTRITHLLRHPRTVEWLQAGGSEPLLDAPSPSDPQLRLSLRVADYTDGQRLLIVRDISKLMQLEQVRRDFVANVSHELRTPLTVIHGYLDMLDPSEQPAWAEVIEAMRRQSARMTSIVEDLLTLSRLESLDRIRCQRVSMAGMLSILQRDGEALSQGRHRLQVRQEFAGDLLGSAKELQSAFSNLISNAVRYTPAGGRIEVVWEAFGDGARLRVSDSGPGIAAQHLPRITERFYRISASRSRDSGGTGLGLAIVKHALQLHQARLDVRSELGRGSEFCCVFEARQLLPAGSDQPSDADGALLG